MKYFLISTIYDEGGNHVALAGKREIDAVDVVGVLKEKLDKAGHGEDTQSEARPGKEKKSKKDKPDKKPKGERKGPTCKKCGETGHLAKTCKKDAPVAAAPKPAAPKNTREQVRELQAKGMKSHEIARELGMTIQAINYHLRAINAEPSGEEAPAGPREIDKEPIKLTYSEFNTVKDCQEEGDSMDLVKAAHKFDLEEIRRAFNYDNYPEYLDSRKKSGYDKN